MNLFGKKKEQPKPSIPQQSAAATNNAVDTIRSLREHAETLDKREQHISKKVEAALLEAKQKAAKKDKKGALFALKRKKMFESEIMKLQGARITLDSQINALESAAVNIETLKAMSSGAKAMKQIRGNMDAEAVDEMLDDLEEEKAIHDQIADAISRPGTEMFDDEDLLNELAELEALEEEESLAAPAASAPIKLPPAPTSVFNLPSVPTTPILPQAPVESEEERALRELQASMLA